MWLSIPHLPPFCRPLLSSLVQPHAMGLVATMPGIWSAGCKTTPHGNWRRNARTPSWILLETRRTTVELDTQSETVSWIVFFPTFLSFLSKCQTFCLQIDTPIAAPPTNELCFRFFIVVVIARTSAPYSLLFACLVSNNHHCRIWQNSSWPKHSCCIGSIPCSSCYCMVNYRQG